MPKPCHKPLRTNPFETYRDPVTGQWRVKYPAIAPASIAPASLSQAAVTQAALKTAVEDDRPQRVAKSRRWKKEQTQVA